jgi:hypothetical protein
MDVVPLGTGVHGFPWGVSLGALVRAVFWMSVWMRVRRGSSGAGQEGRGAARAAFPPGLEGIRWRRG